MFQSTHPRGVRLLIVATASSSLEFQSTHPRGVRRFALPSSCLIISFNPRTHEGCDLISNTLLKACAVSIHAPTRGATDGSANLTSDGQMFQSTHPRGVRQHLDCLGRHGKLFQSTHPRGVRRIAQWKSSFLLSFNPRTHEGCDL